MATPRSVVTACYAGLFLCTSCAGPHTEAFPRPVYRDLGNPIVLQHSNFLVIPFWLYSPPVQGWTVRSSAIANNHQMVSSRGNVTFNSSGGYLVAESIHWNNLIFYDKTTGRSEILLDHQAVICQAYFPGPLQERTAKSHFLLLGIAEHDTNRDGDIDRSDAVVLYARDTSGGSLIRLTPEGTQVDGVTVDQDQMLYVRVRSDSNNDQMFTAADDLIILRVNLAQPHEGQPIVNEELKRLQSIIEAK